jgi:manganese oxidase
VTGFELPLLGTLAWIDVVLLAWFALTFASVAYVAYDAWRNNPELTVLRWGWVLLTVYLGPLGLAVYVLSCKEPRPGTHEAFVRPMWKQAMGSTIHCVAGDATGIIVAATVTALVGFPMWLDLVIEYAVGFGFGLLIFQALFMRNMMGGSYRAALRMSLVPEWLSMNMMMAGMIPVMVAGMMGRDMRAMLPEEPLYWGVMSLGVAVGFAAAYPVNWWLVAKGRKHGMGTRPRSGRERVDGHRPAAPAAHAAHAAHQGAPS